MKTNPKIQESLQLKKKAIALLSKAIAKIILKFRLPKNELIKSLDESLVLQAKIQDPEASNVAIAIRTGIDRRYISRYLNGDMPEVKPDKLAVILEDIRWTAHKFYNSTKIPKVGPFRTFQSICEQRASGTLTYKAILEELITNGNIVDLGSHIQIKSLKIDTKSTEINYSQITAVQINRNVATLIHNSSEIKKENKLIQRTIYSSQINPQKHTQLHIQIEKIIDNCHKKISKEIIDFEDDVEVGTYQEYGISFLEYIIEEEQNE